MVFEFFRVPNDSGLDGIEQRVITMINDCRHTFDAAMNALVGGTAPDAVAADIRDTDARINQTEREVRRELVVHAAVQGTGDTSTILAYMLVSRMLERIGDNAKNIFDLAEEGISLEQAGDADKLRGHRDEISELFVTTGAILAARDSESAETQLARIDALLKEFDDEVMAQVRSPGSAAEAVPRALLARYLKRIAANLANVMSSVVLPVDQMDYYRPDADGGDEDT
jgi:phosphate transport system protein